MMHGPSYMRGHAEDLASACLSGGSGRLSSAQEALVRGPLADLATSLLASSPHAGADPPAGGGRSNASRAGVPSPRVPSIRAVVLQSPLMLPAEAVPANAPPAPARGGGNSPAAPTGSVVMRADLGAAMSVGSILHTWAESVRCHCAAASRLSCPLVLEDDATGFSLPLALPLPQAQSRQQQQQGLLEAAAQRDLLVWARTTVAAPSA